MLGRRALAASAAAMSTGPGACGTLRGVVFDMVSAGRGQRPPSRTLSRPAVGGGGSGPWPKQRGRGGGGGGGSAAEEEEEEEEEADARLLLFRGQDGTLTVPCMDFAAMKRGVGAALGRQLAPKEDLLAALEAEADPGRAARAWAAVDAVEEAALGEMRLMPGAEEVCAYLDGRGIKRGLVTRNNDRGVAHLHRHHLPPACQPFWPALSRDFKPYKPDPAALHHICGQWGHELASVIMLGDSAKDDVVSGNRAGVRTILFDSYKRYQALDDLEGEMRPTWLVWKLEDVIGIIEAHYDAEGQGAAK